MAARRGKLQPLRGQAACGKLQIPGEISEKRSSVAKAGGDFVGLMRGLKPPHPSALSFSARRGE
jgi:hypothetical protein